MSNSSGLLKYEWIDTLLKIMIKGYLILDFHGGPVVKTLGFQFRGCKFSPLLQNSDPTCLMAIKKGISCFDISSDLDNMNINVPRALGWGFCQKRNCPESRTLHSARFLHYWGLIGVQKIWLCLWVNFNNDFFRSYRWCSSSSKEKVKQGLRDPGEEPVLNGNNDKGKLGPQCSATRGPC